MSPAAPAPRRGRRPLPEGERRRHIVRLRTSNRERRRLRRLAQRLGESESEVLRMGVSALERELGGGLKLRQILGLLGAEDLEEAVVRLAQLLGRAP